MSVFVDGGGCNDVAAKRTGGRKGEWLFYRNEPFAEENEPFADGNEPFTDGNGGPSALGCCSEQSGSTQGEGALPSR